MDVDGGFCCPPLLLLISCLQPSASHPLTQAALLQELLFQRFDLLVQQIVGLVNQADGEICHHLGLLVGEQGLVIAPRG
jgi:hypothetical protein